MNRFVQIVSSLRLTVIALIAAMVLVLVGTLAQVDQGLYNAQNRFFRSIFVYWSVPGSGWRIPIFPGGYLVGAVLLLNLLAALIQRFQYGRKNVGLILVHVGIILLLIGQLTTDYFQVESHMRLREGEALNYSEDSRETELVFITAGNNNSDEVIAIPTSNLQRQKVIQHPRLPFSIKVAEFHPNSRLQNKQSTNATAKASSVTQGVGVDIEIQHMPSSTRMDERNLPSAVIELVSDKGSLGSWLVSSMIEEKQTVAMDSRSYQLALRFTRYYKPFSLELQQFRHDKYLGTEIPKNFSSRVRIRNPEKKEDREVLIYMNNPLRYGGETFYQSGYDERDPKVTILQVVRNPGWVTPYISCILVSIGLCMQFFSHLWNFMAQRRLQ